MSSRANVARGFGNYVVMGIRRASAGDDGHVGRMLVKHNRHMAAALQDP